MNKDVISAKLDIIFKKLFLSDNEVLTDFIEAMLDMPKGKIQKLELNNSELLPTVADGKLGKLDFKIEVDDKIVNIEMQMQNKGDFKDRTLYYWSKLYSGELKAGEHYTDLKQTICINILNFNLFDCKEPYSTFKLMETKRQELLTEKCIIMFFELKKVNKTINKNDRKQLWLQLINAETEEDLNMLKNTEVPEINKAIVILRELSEDETTKVMAEAREKAIRDETSALAYAKNEGRAEGRAEGMAEGEAKGRAEAEERMIAILRATGMSEEQIKEILE